MDRPKVGVGVIVKKDGKILLQKRQGSHGHGMWSLPGGHLEFGEQVEDCAARETLEETGVAIKDIRVLGFTNDTMPDGKHYITIFVESSHASGEASIREPEKTTDIGWFSWDSLPQPLFWPLKSFVEKRGYPRQ
jgi:8-oxo-dGTP diphosphatase